MKDYKSMIDSYLTDRLSKEDKADFENRLSHDAALHEEFRLQRHIVTHIRKMRAQQLKSMLQKVSIPPAGFFTKAIEWASSGKIVLSAALSAAILGGGTFIYTYVWRPVHHNAPTEGEFQQTESTHLSIAPSFRDGDSVASTKVANEAVSQKATKAIAPVQQQAKTKNGNIQTVTSVAPAAKASQTFARPNVTLEDSASPTTPHLPMPPSAPAVGKAKASYVEVQVNPYLKKNVNEYRIVNRSLYLYGDFSKGLYEVIEVAQGSGTALYLYYNNEYFALDDNLSSPTRLEPLKDAEQIRQIKAYRK